MSGHDQGTPPDAPRTGLTGELTATARGVWEVRTRSATYVLDLDAPTLTRYPARTPATGFPEPAGLRKDGAEVPPLSLVQCRVGLGLVAVVDVRGDGVATVRASTEVLSIQNLTPDGPGPGLTAPS